MRKEPRIKLPKWTNAARGEECVGCGGQRCSSETTVAAHVKLKGVTNHGMGTKPDDFWIAFLGSHCHFDLDHELDFRSLEERLRLIKVTWRRLHEKGVVK